MARAKGKNYKPCVFLKLNYIFCVTNFPAAKHFQTPTKMNKEIANDEGGLLLG